MFLPQEVALSALQMKQFADQAKITLLPQLIKGISREYFNRTTNYISRVPLVSFKNRNLNLNDLESVMLSFGSSLQYRHKLPVFE